MSISTYMSKIASVSSLYSKKLQEKTAQDLNNIANIVKRTIKSIQNDPSMQGVFYASNIQYQNMGDYYHVNFLLNVDKSDEGQQTLENNKAARDQLINNEVTRALRSFLNTDVRIDFGEHPADKPGWFTKEYD